MLILLDKYQVLYKVLSIVVFFVIVPENVPTRNSDVDYRFLEAAKAGDLDTVQVSCCSASRVYFLFLNIWFQFLGGGV